MGLGLSDDAAPKRPTKELKERPSVRAWHGQDAWLHSMRPASLVVLVSAEP